ncbi:hypothetical protein [Pelagicoccus sp. SDUM812005]|uniref:tetratricopeptide repeat protein n=1 Tax=Pelagicoccus sp. SDUM812005 TaxID=3041257 RepID=UPI00280DE4B1|nr:hypothetical protein [Pelagicoccus sp. SDUM812005]MDQ8182203.1 hypothetical protein [Pelagicoccus sp. SDUM812005]
MKDIHKIDLNEVLQLRAKRQLTNEDSEPIAKAIRAGNPGLSYYFMHRAWLAGAWPLLESLTRLHLSIDPKSPRSYTHLAFALGRQNRVEEADWTIREAYDACGDTAAVEYETALILAMDGFLPEAKVHIRNYIYLMAEERGKEVRNPDFDGIFELFLKDHSLPIRVKFHDVVFDEN